MAASSACITDDWSAPTDAGDAQTADRADATDPTGRSDAASSCEAQPLRALSLGHTHFGCVIRCDGGVWCWGSNTNGQLGDGTTGSRATPVAVRGLDGPATALATGYQHACAVVRGALFCWGSNEWGQLGDGTRNEGHHPGQVAGLDARVVSVAAGGVHTCALLEDGSLRCWGHNLYGALGDGSAVDRLTPRAVVALAEPIASVVAGQYSTCALSRKGTVSCWGFNVFGVLGDGTVVNRSAPSPVTLPGPARSIALAANHMCAALETGEVRCWGINTDGGVGDGTIIQRTRPTAVRGLDIRAASVVVGNRHSCALSAEGAVRCWGANERGQLGDGTIARSLTPREVVGLDGPPVALAATEAATCAALSGGGVRCWGAVDDGMLGEGVSRDSTRPVPIALPP
jgi:alpha-tubulin suppressor-like RCC1 family protein